MPRSANRPDAVTLPCGPSEESRTRAPTLRSPARAQNARVRDERARPCAPGPPVGGTTGAKDRPQLFHPSENFVLPSSTRRTLTVIYWSPGRRLHGDGEARPAHSTNGAGPIHPRGQVDDAPNPALRRPVRRHGRPIDCPSAARARCSSSAYAGRRQVFPPLCTR